MASEALESLEPWRRQRKMESPNLSQKLLRRHRLSSGRCVWKTRAHLSIISKLEVNVVPITRTTPNDFGHRIWRIEDASVRSSSNPMSHPHNALSCRSLGLRFLVTRRTKFGRGGCWEGSFGFRVPVPSCCF